MIGIDRGKMTTTSTMINEVNTMTPRQNDLVVKNSELYSFHLVTLFNTFLIHCLKLKRGKGMRKMVLYKNLTVVLVID